MNTIDSLTNDKDLAKTSCSYHIPNELRYCSIQLRMNMSKDLNCSKELLEALSKDENWIVRCNIATNINSSIDILDRLSKDIDHSVRYYATQNTNTSNETLKELLNDPILSSEALKTLIKKKNLKLFI